MGVLRLLAAAALLAPAACYEPRLVDCVVRCSSNADCAPGQTCGAQGYCAAPELACTASGSDAGTADGPGGPRRPDAGPRVQLRTRVAEGGTINVDDIGICDADGESNGDCLFSVAPAVPLTLRAVPHGGYKFDRWMSAWCAMAAAICVFTPTEPLTEVRVKFAREGEALLTGDQ